MNPASTTFKIKENSRQAIALQRQEGRNSLLLTKRRLLLSDQSDPSNSQLSDAEFKTLFQTFRKPNTPQCYEALKRLNSAFFDASSSIVQNRWIDSFFVDGDRIVHNLVGVFTSSHLDESRVQPEAGVLLANLCCTADPKQKSILARLASPYFVSFLADGPETTRLSLALVSLHGLGNLASEPKNKKVADYLIAQHALETSFVMIGHNETQIREAALFAFESVLNLMKNIESTEKLSGSIKNLARVKPDFGSIFYEILAQDFSSNESMIGQCARCLFLLSSLNTDLFPTPNGSQLEIILSVIEKAKIEWILPLILPLWRSIGTFLDRSITVVAFTDRSQSIFFHLTFQFLQSPYVALRKETLWVFASYLVTDENRRRFVQKNANEISLPIISTVAEIGTLSLCKDSMKLCVYVFYDIFCFSGSSSEDGPFLDVESMIRNQVLSKVNDFLRNVRVTDLDERTRDMCLALMENLSRL